MADETQGKAAKAPKGETPEDKKIRLELEVLERTARIQEVQLESAELGLEAARDSNAQLKAAKAAKKLQNKQRQDQLSIDRRTLIGTACQCSHKQGGSPDDRYGGEGDSALVICTMPDGFTRLIMCSICPLRVFSPHPRDMAKRQRPGETGAERDERVAQYQKDLAEFNTLIKMANRKKTKEAKQEMNCGVVMDVTDVETGQKVQRLRPCDTYAVRMRGVLREIHQAA